MLVFQADIQGVLNKNVRKGAELLDIRSPGWAERVEIARLDMSSTKNDVIAQVFDVDDGPSGNGYSKFVGELREALGDSDCTGNNPSVEWLQRYGFMADPFYTQASGPDPYTLEEQYLDLNKAWERAIEERA